MKNIEAQYTTKNMKVLKTTLQIFTCSKELDNIEAMLFHSVALTLCYYFKQVTLCWVCSLLEFARYAAFTHFIPVWALKTTRLLSDRFL